MGLRSRLKRSAKRKNVATCVKDKKMHKKNTKLTAKAFKLKTDAIVAEAWENERGITENLTSVCPGKIDLSRHVPKEYTPYRVPPLSTEQALWAGKLVKRWGDNFAKMEKDRTRNPWQWRENELRRIVDKYNQEVSEGRHED